jgi:NADH dehydrogenase [ubiquinone] 1 alpha subcomplex assembly factor 3
MDVLGNTPVPATSVTACLDDGFVLNSGVRITGSGALLVGGEAFRWSPWQWQGEGKRMVSERGVWDLGMSGQGVEGKVKEVFGLLEVLWPRPGESIFSRDGA